MAEGFHDFAAAEVLTAANTDDYLMRQTVMRFASAAARDSALSGVLVEGMAAILKDVNKLTVYDGAAWADMGYYSTLPTWTPTLRQATDVAATVNYASYQKLGRMVIGAFQVVATAAGTGSQIIEVTLPLTAAAPPTGGLACGAADFYDASVPVYWTGTLKVYSATTFAITPDNSTNFIGSSTITAALASGDRVTGQFCYAATT